LRIVHAARILGPRCVTFDLEVQFKNSAQRACITPPRAMATAPNILDVIRGGRRDSLDQLVSLVYDDLRVIAHRELMRRRGGGAGEATVNTTGLVNEAYLKLVDQTQANWNDRAHFFALASVAMRHILIDRARGRAALKRGSARAPSTLEDDAVALDDDPSALLDINDALDRLAQVDARLARVVECRFFGGMSEEETATALGVTVRTIQRDWTKARALLRRDLDA